MLKLKNIGVQPGHEVTLVAGNDNVRVTGAGMVGGVGAALPHAVAAHLFVAELA